jgi:hypothetical protein
MRGQPGYMADQDADQQDEAADTAVRSRGDRKADRRSDAGGVERVTVNLSARASRALEMVTKLTGDTKTDAISRALQVYAFFEETTADGGSLYIQESKDAPLQLVKIF